MLPTSTAVATHRHKHEQCGCPAAHLPQVKRLPSAARNAVWSAPQLICRPAKPVSAFTS